MTFLRFGKGINHHINGFASYGVNAYLPAPAVQLRYGPGNFPCLLRVASAWENRSPGPLGAVFTGTQPDTLVPKNFYGFGFYPVTVAKRGQLH
jgi:hypothetical protein